MEADLLIHQIEAVLQTSLDDYGIAVGSDGNIVLTVSRNDYEYHWVKSTYRYRK